MLRSLFTFLGQLELEDFHCQAAQHICEAFLGVQTWSRRCPKGRFISLCYGARQSPPTAPGLRQQGSAFTWSRNILHDQNTTISTFVKLQGQEQFNSFLKQANFLELFNIFLIIFLFMHGQVLLCYRYFLSLPGRIIMCRETQIIQSL